MRKPILLFGSILVLFTFGSILGVGSGYAADNKILGLHYYPGAVEDPANPAINAPQMQNVHLLTSDPYEKVLEWYSQKLGKFTDASSPKGKQALWREEPKEGGFKTVTITTVDAPAGKVRIVMAKASFKKK